jgi:hypothetical protein
VFDHAGESAMWRVSHCFIRMFVLVKVVSHKSIVWILW